MSVYVYHEQQESQLCGQHCLNNLVQEPYYSSVELAEIAQELDQMERSFISNTTDILRSFQEGSGNVDESGNFSFQVLKVALERCHGIEMMSWTGEEGRTIVQDPTSEKAFIINHLSHWYTLRKINDKWWDLNSMKPKPELISPFYLSAFISQLRAEGSTVFIIRGNLASHVPKPSNSGSFPENCQWYLEKSLLEPSSSSSMNNNDNAKQEMKAFSGTANRLGSSTGTSYKPDDFQIEEDDDDDTILAKALSASVATMESAQEKKVLSPAELRLKRLEALQKK